MSYSCTKIKTVVYFVIVIFTLSILLGSINPIYAKSEINLDSSIYLLGEPKSGVILEASNIHEEVYPASITKIMTLLLTLEALEKDQISLNDEVVVPKESEGIPGTTVFLSQGDKINVEDLITSLAVGSANDASVALAKHVSGTKENFVEDMNDRAKELGMKNTNFENPHGLHHDEHVTTAHDIFVMSKELDNYSQIYDWLSIWLIKDFLKGDKVSKDEEDGVYLSNTNRLINDYPGCDGYKTGFTEQAGHSISATAEQDGDRFIAIVMGEETSEDRFENAMKLLDYSFANYRTEKIFNKDDILAQTTIYKGEKDRLPLKAKQDMKLVLDEGEDEIELQEEYNIPEGVMAPIEKGEKVGNYKVLADDKQYEIDLVSAETIEEANFIDYMSKMINYWVKFGDNSSDD
ncbi:D-alanyl-D-alanine carboxypeptidase family protein [Natranaerobius trueperi]|uniref:serine-type D-Ala-D-Ala carboxypeptidase n=1 Tax=Natranaerobius trueperi TaxID=759412 RepID=A0A226BYH8_9FIRM|nr:D-alanyl-D-alanine carboxypeptidase family protein [Natranaerobius trueperi]OWZ83985.1 D-alanyl-D-alanine carboxypeptidase [Natranaerobius trueperi]